MTYLDGLGFTADIIRQVNAQTLLVFDIGLLFFIIIHLVREYNKRGWARTRERLGNQAAIAVGIHLFGLALIRSWSVYMYWLSENERPSIDAEETNLIPLVGLSIAVVGMACCIRIFSPVRWGNWGWMLVLMAAVGFVGYMQAAT